MRVHICGSFRPLWVEEVLSDLYYTEDDDVHRTVQCGPVECNPLFLVPVKNPDLVLARIALSDVCYAYLGTGMFAPPLWFEIGAAAALEKPIYIGALQDPRTIDAATDMFIGDPEECWQRFIARISQNELERPDQQAGSNAASNNVREASNAEAGSSSEAAEACHAATYAIVGVQQPRSVRAGRPEDDA